MLTYKAKLIIWLVVVGMVLACVPSLATPLPPVEPGAINTFIAQTVNAASSQTAEAMPTSTHTATSTPTPSNTDTPTPTFTSTVIFILSTPTPLVIPTFTVVSSGSGGGGGGSSSDNYACQVISVSPANGTAFGSRDDFDAVWRVRNIGQKVWERSSVDYRYLSGDKIHKVEIYDLGSNVPRNSTTDVIVDMVAPRNAGTYSTTWTLNVGKKSFCNMSLRIVVQ